MNKMQKLSVDRLKAENHLPVIFAISGDPGGACALAPVINRLFKNGRVHVKALAYREAISVWTEYGLQFDIIGDSTGFESLNKTFLKLHPKILLSSTSANGVDFERKLAQTARTSGIPSLAVLDFWTNYRMRFIDEKGELSLLPDKIAVMDNRAVSEMVADGFDKDRLVVTGQPALDDILALSKSFTPTDKERLRNKFEIGSNEFMVMFVSEPVAQFYGSNKNNPAYLGFTEYTVLDLLINVLEEISTDTMRPVLVIKPHPREHRDAFADFKTNSIKMTVNRDIPSRELVLSADLVVGMSSMLLVESCYVGCPTLRIQPGLIGSDPLPSDLSDNCISIYKASEVKGAIEKILSDEYMQHDLKNVNKVKNLNAAEKIEETIYQMLSE